MFSVFIMAGDTGLEPVTYCLTGKRSTDWANLPNVLARLTYDKSTFRVGAVTSSLLAASRSTLWLVWPTIHMLYWWAKKDLNLQQRLRARFTVWWDTNYPLLTQVSRQSRDSKHHGCFASLIGCHGFSDILPPPMLGIEAGLLAQIS